MERFRLLPETRKTKNLLFAFKKWLGMPILVMQYIEIGKASDAAGSYQKQILRITLRMTVFVSLIGLYK
jgi:hypothetical protein